MMPMGEPGFVWAAFAGVPYAVCSKKGAWKRQSQTAE
jgi:hypothetical protein